MSRPGYLAGSWPCTKVFYYCIAQHSPAHHCYTAEVVPASGTIDYALQEQRSQDITQSWSLWMLHIWETGRLMPAMGESCECSILLWKAGSRGNSRVTVCTR